MGRLSGRVALISGTARDTGRAAALEFAARGAAVFGWRMGDRDRAGTVDLVVVGGMV